MSNTRLHSFPSMTPTELTRFERKMEAARSLITQQGCWIWPRNGDTTGSQYGVFSLGSAHRLSYLQTNGDLAPGDLVRHTCDIKGCVRPSHLIAGTAQENTADARARGRLSSLIGEANPRAVLTEALVKGIVQLAREGLKARAISELLSTEARPVAIQNVRSVLNGVSWHEVLLELGWPTRPKRVRKSTRLPLDNAFTELEVWKFNTKINRTDSCWLWTGATVEGYGSFYWGGRNIPAHRFMFRVQHNRWPKQGYELSHSCRTALCVNPAHLDEMTRAQHTRFAAAQGWLSAGHIGNRHNQRLTNLQIRQIKEFLLEHNSASDKTVRDSLGLKVTPACVADVRKAKTGGHVVVEGFKPVFRNRKPPLSAADKAEIKRLRATGLKQREIAAEIGRSQAVVSNVLRKP